MAPVKWRMKIFLHSGADYLLVWRYLEAEYEIVFLDGAIKFININLYNGAMEFIKIICIQWRNKIHEICFFIVAQVIIRVGILRCEIEIIFLGGAIKFKKNCQ